MTARAALGEWLAYLSARSKPHGRFLDKTGAVVVDGDKSLIEQHFELPYFPKTAVDQPKKGWDGADQNGLAYYLLD